VLSDQIICYTGPQSKIKCPDKMRRIVLWDEKNQKKVVLLTNHLTFGATTIAKIYRDRWEIELFFKTLKQHLKIKTFVGTTPNALATQIWTALIAILLVKFLQFKSKCKLTPCRLIALLRLNLFSYRDLWKWLDDPFAVPPIEPVQQLKLTF
jgi:IS4 transposase